MKTIRIISLAAAAIILGACSGCGSKTFEECVAKGKAEAAKNNWAEVLHLAGKAVELAPGNSEAYLFRSIAAERCGKNDLAEKMAALAIQMDSKNAAAHFQLGRLLSADSSRYARARSELLRAWMLDRDNFEILLALFNLSQKTGSRESLFHLKNMKRLADHQKDPFVSNELGIVYTRLGNYSEARTAFVEACRNGKKQPLFWLNLATFFEKHVKSAPTAVRFYREFLRLTDGDVNGEYDALREDVQKRIAHLSAR